MGFRQVQINATARNRASVSLLSSCVGNFAGLVRRHSQLEFLHPNRIQTQKSLSEGPLNLDTTESGGANGLPPNVSMLVYESKRTGVLASP